MTEVEQVSSAQSWTRSIKVISMVLVLAAIALQIWHLVSPLPAFLDPVFRLTLIALLIHAIEGLVAAALIFRYRQDTRTRNVENVSTVLLDPLPASTPLAVIKAGLYVFFVGTVGLKEVLKETA